MIASLPMYDRPECRAATDRFWAAIRDALRADGIDAPETLTRSSDPWADWTDPGLCLSQTCSLPYRTRLKDKVTLVAAPDFGLPGCGPGEYCSVILAREAALPGRPRAAVNDPLSQSGWAALWAWAEGEGLTLGPRVLTGGHAASVRAVAGSRADVAAIDAQTWTLIKRHEGDHGLCEIARTQPSPALPYITAGGRDPAPFARALAAAVAGLSPGDRQALGLRGIHVFPADAYLSLPVPPAP